jgi:hypothetical protein
MGAGQVVAAYQRDRVFLSPRERGFNTCLIAINEQL